MEKNKKKELHFPRWEELPDIPLYMDQVILILEQALKVFDDSEKLITPNMINNYVKNRVVDPPVKKKYQRSHVAQLLIITIMKRVLTLNEITVITKALIDEMGEEEGYNLFCSELEVALEKMESLEEASILFTATKNNGVSALHGSIAALMGKIYIQKYVKVQE